MNLFDCTAARALHDTFCRAAEHDANDVRYYRQCERIWHEFHRAEFTAQELELVIDYVKKRNAIAGSAVYRRVITPVGIVGDLQRFCENLQEAKRLKALRDKCNDPRQNTLNAWRGAPPEQAVADNIVPIKDALKKAINSL
jgi:hypothetical protein